MSAGVSAAEEIQDLASSHAAQVSVWVGGLAGAAWLTREADVVHPAASTFKVALVQAVHEAAGRGELALTDEVDVRRELPSVAGGTYTSTPDYDNDDLPWLRLGGRASLGWLAERALVRSSNLATNLLLQRIGLDAVARVYADAGATGCVVRRGIQDPAPDCPNEVTAAGLAAQLRHLAASVEVVMARCENDQMAAAGLPAGTPFAHKPGWFAGVCHDHGVVRPVDGPPFVLVVLTASGLDEAGARRLVAQVAAVCWSHRRELSR